MSLAFRTLTDADLELADTILVPAYGSARGYQATLRRYLVIQPDGWLLALLQGRPAGIGGFTDYGTFAHIGLVAVHPNMQRRGVGRALMEELIARCLARGCATVTLDASDAGAPLYEQLQFRDDRHTLIFTAPSLPAPMAGAPGATPMRAGDLEEVVALDAPIFGADRRAVLAAFLADVPDRAFVARDERGLASGFVFAQEQAIGPWAARDPGAAELLLAAALTQEFDGVPRVCVPEVNQHAAELLMRSGFTFQRRLRRMRYGAPLQARRSDLYAQASLALG